MITTPTVSGKPGQAPTGLSCDLYPLIGSQHLDRSSGSRQWHVGGTAGTNDDLAPGGHGSNSSEG